MQIDVITTYLKNILGQNKLLILIKILYSRYLGQDRFDGKIFKSLYNFKQANKF